MISAEEREWRARAGRRLFSIADMANGSVTCLICRGWPRLNFWKSSSAWTIMCPQCPGGDVSGFFETRAAAIAQWNKRNARVNPGVP